MSSRTKAVIYSGHDSTPYHLLFPREVGRVYVLSVVNALEARAALSPRCQEILTSLDRRCLDLVLIQLNSRPFQHLRLDGRIPHQAVEFLGDNLGPGCHYRYLLPPLPLPRWMAV